MKEEILLRLLAGEHINMDERIAAGVWPHPPIPYSDVLNSLARRLEQINWFPRDPSKPREGVFIENLGHSYVCHVLAYGSHGGRVPSRDIQKTFSNSRDAAEFYLVNDLRLPGDLDGWVVKE